MRHSLRRALVDWPARQATPRRRAALVVLAAVLLAHGLGLGLLPQAPGPGWQPDALRPLQPRPGAPVTTRVLQVAAAAAPAAGLQAPAQSVAAQAPLLPARQQAVPPRAAPPRLRPHAVLAIAPQAVAPGDDPLPATSAAATDAAAAASPGTSPGTIPGTNAEPAPDAGGVNVPVYATQLPPPLTLHYALRRGAESGSAELRWNPSSTGYELALDGDLPRQRVIAWASSGSLDAHGIAPVRYTESRRGRERRAANFQRDAGRITFSGPQVQHALLPGAQDRLSWLLQLPAVLAANPALAAPGAQVAMLVAGSRGDAEVWTFGVIGTETVALAGGEPGAAVHLRREPTRPYDTQADVWLDPARHHLPVRVQLRPRGGGDGTELLLLADPAPP